MKRSRLLVSFRTTSNPIQTRNEEKTMSEITDILQQKTGMGADQAQEVEQLILQVVMSKVPPEFQGIVSSVLGTGGASAAPASGGGLGNLLGMAEGLLEGNKG
jgi:hypothetical protein